MTDEIAALLQVTSGDIGRDGTAPVVLRWESVGEAVAYRLFRREDGQPADSAVEINGRKPVRLPLSAAELHEIVSPDSPEWETLARTLTAARPGAGPGDGQQLVDPDEVFARGLTDTEARFVQAGAQASLTMGRVAGLAFVDTRQPDGASLQYELRGILRDGSELILATAVPVVVGVYALPAYPSGLIVQPGDRRVLVLWNRNVQGAATYMVERAMGPGGPFTRINPQPVAYDVTEGIDGTALPFPQPGFLDAGAWDPVTGDPIPHLVQAAWVSGPDTGWTYWYRVAAGDTLDRWGPWSPPVAATPVRSLPPMAPDELVVLPTTTADGLTVQWRTVYRNVENHRLVNKTLPDPLQKTYVYRAETREELEDIAGLPSHLVTTRDDRPAHRHRRGAIVGRHRPGTRPAVRHKAVLLPPAGGGRVRLLERPVRDRVGHRSRHDPARSDRHRLGDRGCRSHPHRVEAEPRARRGRVSDLSRGVRSRACVRPRHHPRHERRDRRRAGGPRRELVPLRHAAGRRRERRRGERDARGPGRDPLRRLQRARRVAHLLCLLGPRLRPLRQPLRRRRQRVPPRGRVRVRRTAREDPAEGTRPHGSRARNHAVEIEWVGAPEQDLHAFHVYRSEKESDPGHFIACVFTDGSTHPAPWTGEVPSCAAVPAVADPLAARGSYTDTEAEPHKIFWYRVSAVDWLGNESEAASLERLPASSTFSYSSDRPAVPSTHPGGASAADVCGLGVEWDPPFDVNTQRGFVVFRATAGKPFRQVSGVVTGNGFLDETARRGVDYLYCVQTIDLEGNLSEPSAPSTRRY